MSDKLAKVADVAERVSSLVAQLDPTAGMIIGLGGRVGKKLGELLEFRARTWWKHVVEEKSDDDFERTLEYEELSGAQAAVILEALRSALEVVDDASLVPLARLTRMYVRTENGKRDRFFRGCSRMLRDASDIELNLLRRLVLWSLNAVQRENFKLVQRGMITYVVRDEFSEEEESRAGIHATIDLDAGPVFDLLADYEVLRKTSATYAGYAPPNIEATREVFVKLRHILTGVAPSEGA